MLEEKLADALETVGTDSLVIATHLAKHGVICPQAITDREIAGGISWAGTDPHRWRDWLIGLGKKTTVLVPEQE